TEVIRAAITLKLCNYEDTGAIIAAHTTSIPEAPGTQRNWDYRYCWLRDAFFVIKALNRLGATQTLGAYIHYITNIPDHPPTPPATATPRCGPCPASFQPIRWTNGLPPTLPALPALAPCGLATRRPSS